MARAGAHEDLDICSLRGGGAGLPLSLDKKERWIPRYVCFFGDTTSDNFSEDDYLLLLLLAAAACGVACYTEF